MNKIQKLIEENVFWLIVLTLLVIGVAMMVEILPLAFSKSVTQPIAGVKPIPRCNWPAVTFICAKAATTATRK